MDKARPLHFQLRSFFAEARSQFPVSLAYLFGSQATGRAGAQSDCDLAVLFDCKLTSDDRYLLAHQLTELLDTDVDLVDLARSTPIAFSVSGKCWVNNHAHVLRFENSAVQKFVEVYLNSISIEEFVTGAAQPKLNQKALNSIPIPIPEDVATQQIVAEIEAEQALIAANRELIARMEKKIQATLARVWGEAS